MPGPTLLAAEATDYTTRKTWTTVRPELVTANKYPIFHVLVPNDVSPPTEWTVMPVVDPRAPYRAAVFTHHMRYRSLMFLSVVLVLGLVMLFILSGASKETQYYGLMETNTAVMVLGVSALVMVILAAVGLYFVNSWTYMHHHGPGHHHGHHHDVAREEAVPDAFTSSGGGGGGTGFRRAGGAAAAAR